MDGQPLASPNRSSYFSTRTNGPPLAAAAAAFSQKSGPGGWTRASQAVNAARASRLPAPAGSLPQDASAAPARRTPPGRRPEGRERRLKRPPTSQALPGKPRRIGAPSMPVSASTSARKARWTSIRLRIKPEPRSRSMTAAGSRSPGWCMTRRIAAALVAENSGMRSITANLPPFGHPLHGVQYTAPAGPRRSPFRLALTALVPLAYMPQRRHLFRRRCAPPHPRPLEAAAQHFAARLRRPAAHVPAPRPVSRVVHPMDVRFDVAE